MTPPNSSIDQDITATVLRERSRLGNFIRRRVSDPTDADDILQDVFFEFTEAYRLPEPIEQVSAWLFGWRATASSTASARKRKWRWTT